MSLSPTSDQVVPNTVLADDLSNAAASNASAEASQGAMQTDDNEEQQGDVSSPPAGAAPASSSIGGAGAGEGESQAPAVAPSGPMGEMERRAEERLLDERIRERYQRDLGDMFDDES